MNQKVITVTVNIDMNEEALEDKIIELEKLVEALDGEVVLSLTQNKSYVDKAFYVGKGKVNEIKDYCEKLEAEFVVGGKGIGEQQIELDRRTINREISSITSQLKEIEKNRNEIRKKRINSKEPIISLVGYTNAGKSTLINKLISYGKDENSEIKEVFVKDMLFATLDTYVREGLLLNGSKVMYVDTVGFVSDIPHNLVESFKGTLEEIKYSDLILHVVDISNVNVDEQIKITNDMIKKLECEDKNVIYVFNKVDKLADENIKFQYANIENKVFISAKNDEDIILLLKEIEKVLFSSLVKTELLIPYDKQKIVSNILNNYMPEFVEHLETGSFLKVSLKKEDYEIYKGYEVNEK